MLATQKKEPNHIPQKKERAKAQQNLLKRMKDSIINQQKKQEKREAKKKQPIDRGKTISLDEANKASERLSIAKKTTIPEKTTTESRALSKEFKQRQKEAEDKRKKRGVSTVTRTGKVLTAKEIEEFNKRQKSYTQKINSRAQEASKEETTTKIRRNIAKKPTSIDISKRVIRASNKDRKNISKKLTGHEGVIAFCDIYSKNCSESEMDKSLYTITVKDVVDIINNIIDHNKTDKNHTAENNPVVIRLNITNITNRDKFLNDLTKQLSEITNSEAAPKITLVTCQTDMKVDPDKDKVVVKKRIVKNVQQFIGDSVKSIPMKEIRQYGLDRPLRSLTKVSALLESGSATQVESPERAVR